MNTSKLAQILKLLSTKEVNELKKQLASPLFNNRQLVFQCFEYLIQYQKRHQALPSKALAFQQLFPAQTYKDEKIRLVMSQLVRAIEGYWVHKEQTQNEQAYHLTLASIYRRKKLDKVFEQRLKIGKQALAQQPYRSTDFYFENYRLEVEQYEYEHIRKTSRTEKSNLQDISDTLDKAFIITKLIQACRMLSKQAIAQADYDFGLLSVVLQYVETHNLLETPVIATYYYCYHALKDIETTQQFEQFKSHLFQFESQFPVNELHDLYVLGINCCVKSINSGQAHFLHEILSLYKRGLENEAVLEQGELSRFTFQNIVTTGLHTGEYDWTRWFVENYHSKLEKAYRKSAYRFSLGRLAYTQKQYDEALELLQDTDHKDLLFNLFSKTILLKIYYELQEFKLLDSFLDAFAIFLRRKKVIAYHRSNYKNIIAFTKKLMGVNPYDNDEKTALRAQLEQATVLSEKTWLLEQLDAL